MPGHVCKAGNRTPRIIIIIIIIHVAYSVVSQYLPESFLPHTVKCLLKVNEVVIQGLIHLN